MKEKTKKKFIVALIMLLAIAVLPVGQAQASLQSNPNTQYKSSDKKTPTDWIKQIREMETGQGSMGLNETLNGNLTASSESNNIDIHMMRSTEYGAIAILSASGYGNPKKIQDGLRTTTGNKTGVYMTTESGDYEWVAGGLSGTAFKGVDTRYYDAYGTNNSSSSDYNTNKSNAKVGDAMGDGTTTNKGCYGWHGAGASWVYSSSPYFRRGSSRLFNFYVFNATSTFASRGVAVVGAGL